MMMDYVSGSFGDEVLPDLAEALEFVAVDLSVLVGVAVGVLEAESGEDLIDGGGVNGVDGALGVVVGVEVVAQLASNFLVAESVEDGEAEWWASYNLVLMPAARALLASPVISWLWVKAACETKRRANTKRTTFII